MMLSIVNSAFIPNNGKSLLTRHIVFYCVRQKIYNEVFSSNSMFQSISDIQTNHPINVVYLGFVSCMIYLFIQDLSYKKSFSNLKVGNSQRLIINIEFLLLTLFFLLAKDVKYAF